MIAYITKSNFPMESMESQMNLVTKKLNEIQVNIDRGDLEYHIN